MATLGSGGKHRVLIVDLNNFASFPTMAIGLMVAALRNKGHQVRVLSPLAFDVPATQRENQESYVDHIKRRIHLTDWEPALEIRDILREVRGYWLERPHRRVLNEVAKALKDRPDAILLSAYLQHFQTVQEVGKLAAREGVPLLLGGPMFNIAGVSKAWRNTPGLSAIVGAEVDISLSSILDALCSGGDLDAFAGITYPDGRMTTPAKPLRQLESVPIPDYSDFPWHRYPVRIVPLMSGRGCQWDKCLFCSDVVSASGRTFRTRPLDNVLLEMEEQSRRHGTASFLFLDLKLNSYPDMMRGIAEHLRGRVRGAEWIGTVHVDRRRDNGLSREDLHAAVRGGMRRVSFGLESGSQRLLDRMNKGADVERNAEFIRNAFEAGLSIRCTMFKGFPEETVEDIEQTALFLERHIPYLDRVRFNDFSLIQGTPIYDKLVEKSATEGGLTIKKIQNRKARALYRNPGIASKAYRRAKKRVLAAVYEINRQPLRDAARQFDGLM